MTRTVMVWGAILTAILVGGGAPAALAHKGKLPQDALTLVRQASALLAQNPAMRGEVKERLQAALVSKRPDGVELESVSAALAALERGDIAAARRLLLASIAPAGMPKPPERVTPPRASSGSSPKAVPPQTAQPASPSEDTAMTMAEPLRSVFAGTAVEYGVLAAAALMAGLGLLLLRRGEGVAA